jgi:hypothetical protein
MTHQCPGQGLFGHAAREMLSSIERLFNLPGPRRSPFAPERWTRLSGERCCGSTGFFSAVERDGDFLKETVGGALPQGRRARHSDSETPFPISRAAGSKTRTPRPSAGERITAPKFEASPIGKREHSAPSLGREKKECGSGAGFGVRDSGARGRAGSAVPLTTTGLPRACGPRNDGGRATTSYV